MSKRKHPVSVQADPLYIAYDAAAALGHKPIHDRGHYGCWLCALEGRLKGSVMSGEIFEEKCR